MGHGDELALVDRNFPAASTAGGVVIALPGIDLVTAGRAILSVLPLDTLGDRAQGGQFDAVTVLLPMAGSPLATRETLYAAVTRAATKVRVIGSRVTVSAAVARPVARATDYVTASCETAGFAQAVHAVLASTSERCAHRDDLAGTVPRKRGKLHRNQMGARSGSSCRERSVALAVDGRCQ
ncbi:MAG: exodeoxyribonuclease alpha subunit [Frankiales bacterium]|nr:exodeoxyribonuclease alpha subunit [Frankiales bacterium]